MQQLVNTPPNSLHHSLAIGQYYRVCSFDLGFINVVPTALSVEIKHIDRKKNELHLAIHPASEREITETFRAIARWFDEIYPQSTPANCHLKNLATIEHLIDRGLARFLPEVLSK